MDINQYIGVPFKEDGLTPEEGWNCWALVNWVAREQFGISYPSYSEQYSTPLDFEELDALIGHECRTNWTEIPRGQERPGDVIILRLRRKASDGIIELTHAGLVVRKNKMLHVYRGIETALEDYTRRQWTRRIDGFYRR